MHKEVLTSQQIDILPLLEIFSKDYFLVGGTAIALHIGHRRSIDFDLFTPHDIKRQQIRNIIEKQNYPIGNILFEDFEQIHLVVNFVKLTFFKYQYDLPHDEVFGNIISIPNLLDLAAMKAYALGGRGKWKDYVDLYFILKDHFSLEEISNRAKQLYKSFFNAKLFREQLAYYTDIDYSESVDYLVSSPPTDKMIKNFLMDIAIEHF